LMIIISIYSKKNLIITPFLRNPIHNSTTKGTYFNKPFLLLELQLVLI